MKNLLRQLGISENNKGKGFHDRCPVTGLVSRVVVNGQRQVGIGDVRHLQGVVTSSCAVEAYGIIPSGNNHRKSSNPLVA